ncbi:MAG TPA: carbohydrate kinase family protein [Longimicrobium sp.]|jgi:hypothetical protein|uniref:carbohydrate kinase family protein n=1 Tax=Longimicrobium sp. TaxID=2029185 RepID=UPI002ED8F5A6
MRLGVLGTFVWDTIWTLADREAGRPFQTWGGLVYSLAAAAAARPPGWEIVPLARVGHDLEAQARGLMAGLPGLNAGPGIQVVPIPNNRVELFYNDHASRDERQTGGVGGWEWSDLAPRVAGLDALYVNHFSGLELSLEAAEQLRAEFHGPIYSDLHSLFLTPAGHGVRERRKLPEWERWAACFDAVQLNEEELGEIGGAGESMERRAGRVLDAGPGLALVTLGERGAASGRRLGFSADPTVWPAERGTERAGLSFVQHPSSPATGDPTGCGDVWGITCFCGLLSGLSLEDAVQAAHRMAVRKLGHRGASGLYEYLITTS